MSSYRSIEGSHDLIDAASSSVAPDTISADPRLLPLAANGGVTNTHALAETSPAIDVVLTHTSWNTTNVERNIRE